MEMQVEIHLPATDTLASSTKLLLLKDSDLFRRVRRELTANQKCQKCQKRQFKLHDQEN